MHRIDVESFVESTTSFSPQGLTKISICRKATYPGGESGDIPFFYENGFVGWSDRPIGRADSRRDDGSAGAGGFEQSKAETFGPRGLNEDVDRWE